MRRLSPGTLLLFFIIVLSLALGGTIFWRLLKNQPMLSNVSPAPNSSQELMTIHDYRSTNYIGAEQIAAISADKLMLAPRRVGIFRIRLFDQFEAENVVINCQLKGLEHQPNFMAFNEFEKIPRGRVTGGLTLNFSDNESVLLQVKAKTAEINLKNNTMKLEKVTLEHIPSKRKIAGRLVFWDGGKKRFTIPDQFFAESGQDKILGKDIIIDPHFNLSKEIFSTGAKPSSKQEFSGTD